VRYLMPELPFPEDEPEPEPVERWLHVAGFEGEYEVSDLGRVRSLDRTITVPDRYGGTYERPLRGRLLRPGPNTHGYLGVNLGRRVHLPVHQLVLKAFADPCPEGHEACHGPGGRTDNRLVNLSWGTRAKNLGPDRRRDGTDPNGDRHGCAKLTWEQVDEIRRRAAPPHRGPYPKGSPVMPTNEQLAAEFGVNRRTVDMIVAGKAWRPEFRRHAS
jgi:hypothetical protein